jgi:CDP-diacylglycerol--glycerol-3-phosphate 3-phosphatidyltransferase
MLNTPNRLSILRILLVPLLVVVLLTKLENKDLIGLAVFLLASLTDFLDGYIARRRQQVTQLGKLLDPAADKLLTSAAFISLVELGLAPAWMVVLIIAREFAVSTLRSVAAAEGLVLGAIVSAKLKTVLQVLAISLLIIYNHLGSYELVATIALWAATLVSVYSGVEYFVRFGPRVFGSLKRATSEL